MNIGQYTLICHFEGPAILPRYKGSVLRGAFGLALRQSVCVLKTKVCSQCPLGSRCLYAVVFEPQPSDCRSNIYATGASIHPYVIEPPETPQTHFMPGDEIAFRILLFGKTVNELPYFIHAIQRTGELGIGRRIEGHRGKFVLDRVLWKNRVVYSKQDDRLCIPPAEAFSLSPSSAPEANPRRVRVYFRTPTRIRHEKRFSADVPFEVLIRAALRRISILFANFDTGEPDMNYSELVAKARDVVPVTSDIRWLDGKRHSFRQHQDVYMGGLVGDIVYEGALAPYLPLLDLCSVVHIGKQTTFGLGRIDIEVENAIS